VRAVDGVDLSVEKGRTLGVVGESGCGKSTLGRAVLQLEPHHEGSVVFDGTDLSTLGAKDLRAMRKRMQMVFQDPLASLDPRQSVASVLAEPLRTHGDKGRHDKRCASCSTWSGCRDAANRYPHEFSGGQRQRVGIARAIALNPELIIADEPVSALDVSIQAQVVNLLEELQERLGLTYVVIAHDLAVGAAHQRRHRGHVPRAPSSRWRPRTGLYDQPLHPYTRSLLSAIPIPDPRSRTPASGSCCAVTSRRPRRRRRLPVPHPLPVAAADAVPRRGAGAARAEGRHRPHRRLPLGRADPSGQLQPLSSDGLDPVRRPALEV
jgi:peptide/nickel transport system ATP-binding protein